MKISPLLFHKALPVFLLPLGAALLLLVVSMKWKKRLLQAAAVLMLWIPGTPVVSDWLMRSLEDRLPRKPVTDYPSADAIVVLGGILQVVDATGQRVEWLETADRFEEGLKLYGAGKAGCLVLTSPRPAQENWISEGEHLRRIAIERGIPEQAVVLTAEVVNTASEAAQVREMAARRGWRRVLLVTSAFHMPRALLLFRRVPVEVIPVPVDYFTEDAAVRPRDFAIHPYLPHAEALFRSEKALREYLGLAFYWLRELLS